MHWPQTERDAKRPVDRPFGKASSMHQADLISHCNLSATPAALHNCHRFQATSRTCFDRSSIIERGIRDCGPKCLRLPSRACTPKQKIKNHSECTFTLWNPQYGIQSAMVHVANVALTNTGNCLVLIPADTSDTMLFIADCRRVCNRVCSSP